MIILRASVAVLLLHLIPSVAVAQVNPNDVLRLGTELLRTYNDQQQDDPSAQSSDPSQPPQKKAVPQIQEQTVTRTSPRYDPSQVAEAQALLNELGYDAGPVDGLMGSKTTRAITAFQRSHGLIPTGVPDDGLLAALRSVAPGRGDSAALAQDGCTPILFARGESAAEISGVAPPEDVVCYSLATRSGQSASLQVVSGRNIIFSITGVVDARDAYQFRTEHKTYEIVVGQLMRSVTHEPFRIRVAVDGSPQEQAAAEPGAEAGPSFDCAQARTPTELTICGTPALATLDRRIADSFPRATATATAAEQDALRTQQQTWLGRRDACGADVSCLNRIMTMRLSALDGLQAAKPVDTAAGGALVDTGSEAAAAVPTAGQGCPASDSERAFAVPVKQDTTSVDYGDGKDVAWLMPIPGVNHFDAADGDDAIYAVDPVAGTTIVGGPGADAIVLCSIKGMSVSVMLGDERAGGADTEPDVLIVEPRVFLGVPPGFERQIFVFGLTQQNDRIKLRLPPGVEFDYRPDNAVDARAGNVAFRVSRTDGARGVDEDAFVIERVDDVPAVPVAEADPPLSVYDPDVACSDADGTAVSGAARTEKGSAIYSNDGDTVRVEDTPGVVSHLTLDGDDLAFLFTSQALIAGAGADQIVICALDDPIASIGLGVGVGGDADADVVIVESGRLQTGIDREIRIGGISPVNDRVVLRVPEGLDVTFDEDATGAPRARVGNVVVQLYTTDWRDDVRTSAEVFIVERAGAVVADASGFAAPPELDGVTCPDPKAPGNYAEGQPPHAIAGVLYSVDDDEVLITPVPGIRSYHSLDGDDLVYLFDPIPGTSVTAGRGADVIVVCSMEGLSLQASLGDDSHQVDVAPDSLILGPDVFLRVPQGARRLIQVFGFMPQNDRLILRLPPEMEVDGVQDTGVGSAEVAVGQVFVQLFRADNWQDKPFNSEAIVVERASAAYQGAGAPVALPSPNEQAFSATCPDHSKEQAYAPATSISEESGLKAKIFGTDGERILISDEPGVLSYNASDGGDLVYINDPIAGVQVLLGSGGDTAILCAMEEIALYLSMGAGAMAVDNHDASADTLIIESPVLADVPAGFTREIRVGGIEENSDRIVLRLPPGMEPIIKHGPTADVLKAVVGHTEITVNTTGDWSGPPADPALFVLQRPGEAAAVSAAK